MSQINYHGDVVVFDLDDTLFRERDFVRSGFRLIESILCRRFGEDIFAGIADEMNICLSRRENYFDYLDTELKSRINIGDNEAGDLLHELIEAYRGHLPESLPLAHGVAGMFSEMRHRGIVMAIVTDGRSVTQRNKIHALGIDRYVPEENILISEETGFDKTFPDNFSTLVRNYPEAKRFIYIADNERKDFLFPNLLGWETCKVLYDSDNVHEDFENADILQRPSHLLSSISQIFDKFNLIGF